jgi:hypothetical protein
MLWIREVQWPFSMVGPRPRMSLSEADDIPATAPHQFMSHTRPALAVLWYLRNRV